MILREGKKKPSRKHHPIHRKIQFFPQNPQGRIQKLNANIHPVGFMATGGALNGVLGVGCFFGGGRDFPVKGTRDWPSPVELVETRLKRFFLKSAGPVDFFGGSNSWFFAPFFWWFFGRNQIGCFGIRWRLSSWSTCFFSVGVNTPAIF